MSEAELARFLGEERVVTCASIGPNGRPHLMPLWYVVDDGVVPAGTSGTSPRVHAIAIWATARPTPARSPSGGCPPARYHSLRVPRRSQAGRVGPPRARGAGRRGRAARGLHDPPPEGDEVPRRLLCVPRRQS